MGRIEKKEIEQIEFESMIDKHNNVFSCTLNVRFANLKAYSISNLSIRKASFIDVDFRSSCFREIDFTESIFINCLFENTQFTRCNFTNCEFDHVKFDGTRLFGNNFLCAAFLTPVFNNVYYDHENAFLALQCPEEGEFIAYKKAESRYGTGSVIVKLLITNDAKRSSATSRKCRASKAKVLEIQDMAGNKLKDTYALSRRRPYATSPFKYVVGKMVYPDDWDYNRWEECSHGIHFFMTRQEAVNYVQ